MKYVKHTDKDVESWACVYANTNVSIEKLEKEIKVPHSTLWWCFTHRLLYINERLYIQVNTKLANNNTSLKNKGWRW